MPLSNASTTELDNFDGNGRSARARARARWLKLADESAGDSLAAFRQVCDSPRDPRPGIIFTLEPGALLRTRAYIQTFCRRKFLMSDEVLCATGKTRTRQPLNVRAGLCFIATTGE